ncbi:hypothetical protein MMC29_005615 [Sticta canariensis]|nr:hypothetical protein [Sticta canariensis]
MANKKTKMPPASVDEQFKFLISCIRYSNNGKVDFTEVANECNIVSKGAAAKRYERMMKQHGLHQSAGISRDPPTSSATKEPKTPTSSSKKRKMASMDNSRYDEEEEEAYHQQHRIKDESDGIVKDEPGTTTAAGIMHYQNASDAGPVKEEEVALPGTAAAADERLFNDFIQSNAFENQNRGGSAYAAAMTTAAGAGSGPI